MKKILLISDTHGYIDDKILSYCKSVDEVWHAGDIGSIDVVDKIKQLKPLKGVYGNIDNHVIRSEFPLDYRFSCEDIKVWITHIGGYPNRYSKRVSENLKHEKVDLFICGHSHILKVINDTPDIVDSSNSNSCFLLSPLTLTDFFLTFIFTLLLKV